MAYPIEGLCIVRLRWVSETDALLICHYLEVRKAERQ